MFKVKEKENFFSKSKDIGIICASFLFMFCTIYFANVQNNKSVETAEEIKVNKEIYTEQITLNYYAINLEKNKIEEIGYKVPLKEYMLNPYLIYTKEYANLNLDGKIVSPFPCNLEVKNATLENGKLVVNLNKKENVKKINTSISNEKRLDAIYKTLMNIKEVEEVMFKIDGKVVNDIFK